MIQCKSNNCMFFLISIEDFVKPTVKDLPSYIFYALAIRYEHIYSMGQRAMSKTKNPGRFGPGSFRPGSFRPGSFRPNFEVGRFGLGRWVDSALGRFGQSIPKCRLLRTGRQTNR